MTLPVGQYTTKAGSTVAISGEHAGIAYVEFDWLEEDACCDCVPEAYPSEDDNGRWFLTWHCEECDGGRALLRPIE